MWVRHFISQVQAQRRTLRVERTFCSSENMVNVLKRTLPFNTTFNTNLLIRYLIIAFSASSAIVDPIFGSRNLIPTTQDWTTCGLITFDKREVRPRDQRISKQKIWTILGSHIDELVGKQWKGTSPMNELTNSQIKGEVR